MACSVSYYCRNDIWIHHGDCRLVMRDFPDAAFDFVLADPPYLVNYQGRWDGDRRTIIGDKDGDWLRPAFTEIWRVLKDDSFCLSFYGWPHSEVFVGLWKELGFRLVSHLAFVKNVWGLGRFTRGQHETAFLLAKGHPPIPAKGISDVIVWEREANAFHPNQKPVGALYPLLAAYVPKGGTVLDPLCGAPHKGSCVANPVMWPRIAALPTIRRFRCFLRHIISIVEPLPFPFLWRFDMFDQLFERPHAVARHRAGPLSKERLRFLTHLAKGGVRKTAWMANCEIKEEKPKKPWREDKGLMEFLRTL